MKNKRLLKSMGGDDYLVLVREEDGKKYVASEKYLERNPDTKGMRLESFLAHNPYWEEL